MAGAIEPRARRRPRRDLRRTPTLAGSVEPVRTRGERRARASGDDTRARVIDVAATCIVEEGVAAASASRIAERAGVTWGVIQYHFGDRAGLFSAVVLAGYEQFRACIDEAEIPERPVRAHLAAVVDAGWRAYSSVLSRASLEILVHTRPSRGSDPEHAAELVELARGRNRIGEELLAATEPAAGSRPVGQLVWSALRGFAMTMMMDPEAHDFVAERDALVDVLTVYLESASPP
jgi:TetR/AcrR family transcriptional regulator, regulator of cefoperazone and chloramphenicol sensitivity